MRRLALLLSAVFAVSACAALAACARAPAGTTDGGVAAASDAGAFDPLPTERAEDRRRAKDVGAEVRTSHDVVARRQSARALARIADAQSLEGLVAHLADEDDEVMTWAAYGLGFGCKGHEDAHVRALSARAASLGTSLDARRKRTRATSGAGAPPLDLFMALGRAIGRCGGAFAEQVLVSLASAGPAWEEPALFGLGDLATRRKALGAEAMTFVLEAVSRRDRPPADEAFYALSRAESGEAFGKRVLDVGRAALARSGDWRLFAIKTIARAGKATPKEVAPELVRVASDARGFTAAERAEAARGLAGLGADGQAAAAEGLARLTPDKGDAMAIQALAGGEFHVLYTLIASSGAEPPKRAEPALGVLANLEAPAQPKPGLARRLAELRCAAALGLARGVYDAEVLRKCDAEISDISEHARLTSLLRRPIVGERKAVFRAFTRSVHLRTREQAVEAVGDHHELGDLGAAILAEALASSKPGLIATAAEVVHTHPETVMVLAEAEKRAALDPRAPPPSTTPAQELSKDVAKALSAALAEKWPEDRFETRIALMEAAGRVRHPQAKAVASAACTDPNEVVRERAQKTLRELGEGIAACNAPPREAQVASEIGKTLGHPAKVVFTTDAGELTLTLDPDLSPVTATRLAALVRSGFYKGIVVHRVVPGFVVQFGDPDGDGYGGSGTSLRCETSPVPFAPLDIGMALAGRDTGSSQLFVTLSRTPHLDGEYTWVGRAAGDWGSVAQGDVIADAKLVE